MTDSINIPHDLQDAVNLGANPGQRGETLFPDIPGGPPNVARALAGLGEAPAESGGIEIGAFVRAQSAFIQAQIRFLEIRPDDNVDGYLTELTRYSRAQNNMITAQNNLLRQMRIV